MKRNQFAAAMDVGRRAHLAASKVRNSLFPRWRQRAFRRHLGRFIVALQQVPQSEAATLSAFNINALAELIDQLSSEAEGFMAERHDATTAEVEQDRFVVTEIYQLRAIAESLARRVTADPGMMDVRWAMKTHQPDHRQE